MQTENSKSPRILLTKALESIPSYVLETGATMVDILDDKSQLCIHFLLEQLCIHEQKYAADSSPPPFFVGLNGVQGAGKTVLVRY